MLPRVSFPVIYSAESFADRRMEVLAEGRPRHQGHSLAGKQPHPAARSTREIPLENNVSGGATLHQSRATRSRHWKMFHGSRGAMQNCQRCRHHRVSAFEFLKVPINYSFRRLLSDDLNRPKEIHKSYWKKQNSNWKIKQPKQKQLINKHNASTVQTHQSRIQFTP